MIDRRGDGSVSFAVGPLQLHVRADPCWSRPLTALLATYTDSYAQACAFASRPRPRLHVEADLSVSLRSEPSPRSRPAFEPREGGGWQDSCFVWDAEITCAADRVRAAFALHDRSSAVGRSEQAVRRDIVASCLRALLATTATLADGFVVHGAGLVAPDGGAALFLGRSGQGKTTLSRRLEHWTSLADDTSLVFRGDCGRFFVCGTPISGKEGLPRRNAAAPLHRIISLEKGARDFRLDTLSGAETFAELMTRVLWFAADPELARRLFDLTHALVEAVPGRRLASSLTHDVEPRLTEMMAVEAV